MSRVGLLEAADEDRWEHFVEANPRAGIYHSLAWRAVTCEGFGHTAQYLCAKNGAGDIVGVMPLFRVHGVRGHRLVSVPMRDRGGPVGEDAGVEHELLAAAIDLARETGAQYLEVRTLDPLAEDSIAGLALRQHRHWVTSRVDLRGGADATWKRLQHKVRQHVRKAEGQGVQVELDSSREGVFRFFDAFVRARTAMGIPPFPREFMDAIWRHLIAAGRANLIMATSGSAIINGMINLLSKDTVIAAYSAPQRAWLKMYPAEMVYWNTISWGAKQGFATFDFGADSPTQEGLIAFKAKFGATTTVMSSYFLLHRARELPNFDSSSAAYALARRVWSWLPDSISRLGGAWITRRLS
jgi:FemAB-related protein (PEP-CTERM system-associated)